MSNLPNEIPKKLFKYRNISDNSIQIIEEQKIYFSSPLNFNDPFDCSIPIRYDKLTEEEHTQFALQLLRDLVPEKSDEEILHLINQMKKEGAFRTQESFKEMVHFQLMKLHNELGVFSLSKHRDNLLLWSHYANNHTGFCIGFDTLKLYEDTGAGIGRVTYLDDYPEIQFSGQGNINDLIVQILTKSEVWSYEDEFRFTHFEGANKLFSIRSESITDLILGCSIERENKESLLRVVENIPNLNHIKVYQAEKHSSKFELEFTKLEEAN